MKLEVEEEEEEEENDSDEKVKTCIDSGKLLKCIQSVRIVCPKSFNKIRFGTNVGIQLSRRKEEE